MARPPHPDLQLTIPADAQFRRVAADLAVKFAEYSGCNAGTASTLRRAVEKLAASVSNGSGNAPIEFHMSANDQTVTVQASSGTRSDHAMCPLQPNS